MEGSPRLFVYLGLQRCLQRLVLILCSLEVGLSNEEALVVVIGVDEPACDAIGVVTDDLPGCWMEHVHPVESHTDLVVGSIQYIYVGLSKDNEKITAARVLELFRHMEISVHPGLQHRDRA